MLTLLRASITNTYVRALGVLLLGWGLLFRFDATSDQRAYWIGHAIGFGLAALLAVGVLSLIFARFRPYALVMAIYVTGVAAPFAAIMKQSVGFAGVTNAVAAEAEKAYVSNGFMTGWMSKDRTICVGRDAEMKTCLGVNQVVSANDNSVDLLSYMYTAGLKITGAMRITAKPAGLCFAVPNVQDFNFTVYVSNSAVAEIGANDQALPLSSDLRAEMWRMGAGASGWQAGDELCTRYTVHEREGNTVLAVEEHMWKNGILSPDDSGAIWRFYDEGARLPLRDVALEP